MEGMERESAEMTLVGGWVMGQSLGSRLWKPSSKEDAPHDEHVDPSPVSRITEAQILEFREAFDQFDRDHSGYIDAAELRQLVAEVSESPTEAEIEAMMELGARRTLERCLSNCRARRVARSWFFSLACAQLTPTEAAKLTFGRCAAGTCTHERRHSTAIWRAYA
jgi:hypothetical protein